MASFLRMRSREARRSVEQSRRWHLRNSLMNNQGLSKEVAKELAKEAVKPKHQSNTKKEMK